MYGVKEIMEITKYGKSKSYRIIEMIQNQMKKEDKNVIIIGKRVPINYFEKYVLGGIYEKEKIEKVG